MRKMTVPDDVYFVASDLFRLGNATSPRLDHVRTKDVDIYQIEAGELMVRANRKGISLLTERRLSTFVGGWIWKLPKGTELPAGLILRQDRPDHYMLCPASDMNVNEYRELLANLAVFCERIRKV
jgi:hypothetical protein